MPQHLGPYCKPESQTLTRISAKWIIYFAVPPWSQVREIIVKEKLMDVEKIFRAMQKGVGLGYYRYR